MYKNLTGNSVQMKTVNISKAVSELLRKPR